ncbi:MAG: glycoside hydrolase family 3 N-terminal domain-containing protein [Propionibacteriaceae bacterium]|nr:glycoside hydrolase family 3 N-terminal domain-containing protein [Propionibacteriaceae bacterium]
MNRNSVLAIGAATLLTVAGCGGPDAPGGPKSPTPRSLTSAPSGSTTPPGGPQTSATSPGGEATHTETETATSCVAETLASLTDDQALGQLLMIGFDTNAPLESLDGYVRDQHVGNVIYLGGWEGTEKVRSTSEHLSGLVGVESTGGVGLMIAADQEGGVVHQLRGDGFTHPPSALEQAAITPAELTAAAERWGAEMAAVGVNVNLAPVADTVPEAIGRANEPIGRWGRQYGSDPAVVGEYVPAFLRGMEAGEVVGLVKHFPGLGRVTGNTDFTSEGIEDDVATVDDPFLEPFVAGMEAGAGMVMMSSAVYPNIDPDNQALYSPAIVTDLLRDRLGWDGVVITDDVNAVSLQGIPAGERAVGFIRAGGDIVLNGDPGASTEMLAALRSEVSADAEFAAQVEASVERVLTLKDEMGLLHCSDG